MTSNQETTGETLCWQNSWNS